MKILIIEDDQSVAELERDYLEINGGFTCTLAADGTQGLNLALEELGECAGSPSPETELVKKELTRVLNAFLSSLPETERNVFLCRYWYLDSIQTISEISGFSQSKVTSMLHRLRGNLRKKLSEEGYV